jgi:P27 family predicted phage terminase small subunit
MPKATKTISRPAPPDELDAEALLEWHRVCDELDAAGRLDKADRALLTLYCQTWEIYSDAMKGVRAWKAVVKQHNQTAGPSPYYKISRETSNQLHKMLASMGLTPESRRGKAATQEPGDLEL